MELTLKELADQLREAISAGTRANAEKIAALEAQIGEIKENVAKAAKVDARPDLSIGYKPTGDPTKDFSWLRFFRGVVDNWSSDTKGFPEYELTQEARAKAKAMVGGLDSTGGFLVAPEILIDQIIPALEPRVVAIAAGATMATGLLGSPVEWPRWDDYMVGYWVGEYEAPSEDELSLSQMSLAPKGCATLVEVTDRLLTQTSGRVEAALRQALANGLARTLDTAVFKGTGGKQPVGILNQLDVGTVDAASTVPSGGATQGLTAFLEALIGKLEDANAFFGRPTWFMHPHTRRWFHAFKDSTGRPLLFEQNAGIQSSATRGSATFYGHPFFTTTALVGNNDDSDLVFANVEEIVIGQWGGLQVAADTSIGFKKGTKFLKASMEVDVGLRHGQSVASALNLDTN